MLRLEVFETAAPEDGDGVLDAHQTEKLRAAAYEQGYAAGWQDALEHMRNEDAMRRIAAEEALQSISFTYHEAHAALQTQFILLTRAILDKLMPEVLRHALAAQVAAELDAIVAQTTNLPVRLSCAPGAIATLQPVLKTVTSLDIDLVAEPSFSDAQVSVCIGAQERQIDLDSLLESLRSQLNNRTQPLADTEKSYG